MYLKIYLKNNKSDYIFNLYIRGSVKRIVVNGVFESPINYLSKQRNKQF